MIARNTFKCFVWLGHPPEASKKRGGMQNPCPAEQCLLEAESLALIASEDSPLTPQRALQYA